MSRARRAVRAPADPARRGLVVLVALAVAGLLARVVTTGAGWFYWDDLTLGAQARAADTPIELLGRVHDGHLMPAGWVLEWVLAHTAWLHWPVAVALAGVLHAVALAAVAWALWTIVPAPRRGPLVLGVPFALYALSPVAIPATAWIAAAIGALPLHAALAVGVALAVRGRRAACGEGPGRPEQPDGPGDPVGPVAAARRTGLWLVVVTAAGLMFTERALAVVPVALAVVGMLHLLAGRQADGGALPWRAALWLFAPAALLTAGWALLYRRLDTRDEIAPVEASWSGFVEVAQLTYRDVLLPAAAGGPWTWERWHPGPPFAAPPGGAWLLGAAVLAAVLALALARRGRAAALLAIPAVYPLAPVAALAMARLGPEAAATTAATMRHVSEIPVLCALVAALLWAAPGRESGPRRDPGARARTVRAAGALAAVVLVASSAVTTYLFARSWSEQPARTYFANLRAAAETMDPGATLLDQDVALEVLLPVVHPDNELSRLVGGADGYPAIAPYAREAMLVDARGVPRPAEVLALRHTQPGPEDGCGTPIGGRAPATVDVPLDGPLIDNLWHVQFGYLATGEGTARIAVGDGPAETVPLQEGLNQLTVRLTGAGDRLRLAVSPEAGTVCLGQARIGGLAPAP